MSLKACVEKALNLTDEDAARVVSSYDAYTKLGQFGKDAEVAAVEDTLAAVELEHAEYMAMIEEQLPESLKRQSNDGTTDEELDKITPRPYDAVMDALLGDPETAKKLAPNTTPVIDKAVRDASNEVMVRTSKNLDKGKASILRWKTLDMVVDQFADRFQGKTTAVYRNLTKFTDNPLLAINELMHQKQREATKHTNEATRHDKRIRAIQGTKYKGESGAEWIRRLGELMNSATIETINVDANWTAPENAHLHVKDDPNATEKNRELHAELHAKFKAMPEDLKNEYNHMRAFYKDQFAKLRRASIENLAQVFGNDRFQNKNINKLIAELNLAKDTATVNTVFANAKAAFAADTNADEETKTSYKLLMDSEKQFKAAVRTMNGHEQKAGPYFPLKRYGKYQMSAVNSETGGKYYFRSDDKAKLEEEREKLELSGVDVSSITAVSRSNASYSSRSANAILEEAMKNAGNNKAAAAEARRAILQAFASHSPEASMQKHFMRRSGVSGADTNVRRNMASYAQAAAWSMASLKYSKDIYTALGTMRKAERLGDEDSLAMSMATNEIDMRVNNPAKAAGVLMGAASKFSFVNYLMSVSYSLVNGTQVAMVTLPRMSEKYGIKVSAKAISDAYALAAPQIGNALVGAKFGLKAFSPEGVSLDSAITNVLSRVSGGTERMLETLRERDMLGGGLTFDVTETAKGKGEGKLAAGTNAFIEMGRTMPMMVEEMNRIVTALATYDLAMQKHGNHDQAVADAERMIVKTHFDYSDLNKPPMFTRNDLMRAVTTYKMHPLGLYSNVFHYIDGIKDPATRKNAMKGLGMFLGMHGIFAGAAGAVLLEPISLLLQAIGATLDDDDELKEMFSNPDLLVRETMYALTGSEKLSEMGTYGLTRGLGIDTYSRIGLHRGLVQVAKGDSFTETFIDTLTESAIGPIFSIKEQWKNTAKHLAAGDTFWNSWSYALPKAAKDVVRAFGLVSNGMKDYSGNTIYGAENFGVGSGIIKGIGLGTSTEAEVHSNRNRDRQRKNALKRGRTKLTRRYRDASPAERTQLFRGSINQYNKTLATEERSEYFISMEKLLKSIQRQYTREQDTRSGVYNKNRRVNNYPYTTLER